MGFWIFLLCCDILIPIVMIAAGRLMWKNPPAKINGVYGYRTSRSMKTPETWKFAHDFAGKLWWKLGWIVLGITVVAHIPVVGGSEEEIAIVSLAAVTVQIILLVGSIIPVEKALKKKFTDTGLPRENDNKTE